MMLLYGMHKNAFVNSDRFLLVIMGILVFVASIQKFHPGFFGMVHEITTSNVRRLVPVAWQDQFV